MKLSANGIEINYSVDGEGPWLVLSHSLACDISMWDPQMDALKRRFKVVRYDTRGHGKTSAPAGAYTLDMLADDLKGLLDGLKITKPHFCGLSMGGMIGQTFALKYPGALKTLILADTTSQYAPEAAALWAGRGKTATEQGMEPLVQGTLERWFTEGYRKSHTETVGGVAKLIRNTPPIGYAGCCQALPKINTTARLKEIKTPIKVICGEFDAGTPLAMSHQIQQNAPGAELAVIANASHLSNVEQPEAFTAALSGFLAKHP